MKSARITIRAFRPGDAEVCEGILRALPDWFGIESALVQYVADTQRYPTWIAEDSGRPAGFVTLHVHFPAAAEVHCIAVRPEAHRQGVGRELLATVEQECRRRGTRFLQVKTVGPSRACEFYGRTRRFYDALGFVPLEEFSNLWGRLPCLLLIKPLDAGSGNA